MSFFLNIFKKYLEKSRAEISDTAIKPWRRASDPVQCLALSWELCPPEILCMIFKNLNGKDLLVCMTVSRRWKDIVMDYIECHDLWEKMVLEEMVNLGRAFKRKSTLNYKEILINSKLWHSVNVAQINLYHTYALEDFIKMHVYKDNLILLMDNIISYFDIKEKKLRMLDDPSRRLGRCQCSYPCNDPSRKEVCIPTNVYDYCENDHMAATVEQIEGYEVYLRVCGKIHPDKNGSICEMTNIILFMLEGNTCYMITDRYMVWALTWHNEEWETSLKGRYYGSPDDTICAMHVSNNRVSMVTKSGLILCEDPKSKKFDKVYNFHSQLWPDSATKYVLFNQLDVVVSVSNKNQRIQVYHDSDLNRMTVKCADMTCATEHGEVLFIGFTDGTVAICIPNNMKTNQSRPQRLFQIQDFDQSLTDPAILELEVFEDKMSHHLFVAVRQKVIQLLITYPNTVKEYYE